MLLLTPLNGERNLPMLVAVSSMFVLSLAGLFLAESFVSEWMLAVIALSMVAGAFLRSWMRYKSVVTLFNNDSLKYGIRYEGTLVFSLIVIALCVLSSVRSEWLDIGAGFLSSLFFSFICLSRVLERSFVMSVRKENELATMLRGNLRNAEMTKDMCDGKMSLLYKKVLRLMKEDEIYTMENLDLDSMARMLYTNKVYLSRTINIMSGRNFCQFVSYYRVAKAVEIMKSSDRVRVEDIAYQVGFHSISSFNIAFKMFNGFTPREWLERYREGGL